MWTPGTEEGETFETQSFAIDLGRFEPVVVDLAMGRSLRPAMNEAGAVVAVNGGFFDPQNRAQGLVVSGGRELAAFDPTLSGGVLTVEAGQGKLWASEEYDPKARPAFAVQCRPRLVVGGAVNVRSSDGRHAERTALCLRRGGRELVAMVATGTHGGPSLRALALHAARAGCEEALNLDGGPSTGVAWRQGGDVQVRDPRGPLRHAVVWRAR